MKLAFLIFGIEDIQDPEKPNPIKCLWLKEALGKLQTQLNSMPKDETEVVFYFDKGEKTIDEKKEWLVGQTEAKKYVFLDSETEITDNFMLLRLNAIKQGKKTPELLKLGIFTKNLN